MTLKECFIDLIQACVEEGHSTAGGEPDCEICCALEAAYTNFPELFEAENDLSS